MGDRLPGVRAVLRHGGRYLLVRHNNRLPENAGKWGTPGGHIEAGDADPVEALRREMREEFNTEIEVLGLVGVYEYRSREHMVFLATPSSTDFVTDPAEILDYAWLTAAEVAEWAAAGRLHTGFELDAIRRSLILFPLD